MKRVILSILLACFIVFPAISHAAVEGSCVFSKTPPIVASGERTVSTAIMLQWVCTADGSTGAVSTPAITGPGYDESYTGTLQRVSIIPGTGDDAPTALNPQIRKSGTTRDMLRGFGSGASVSVETMFDMTDGFVVPLFNDILVPYASGVGNSNKFTIQVILKR